MAAKKSKTNKSKPMGPPKGNKNAAGHGAPKGNQNPRKHGLFAKSLGPLGLKVYEDAEKLNEAQLAREAANFALAKVAEAYSEEAESKGVVRLVEEYLDGLVQEEAISFDAMQFVMRKLTQPDIAALGKALSPIKGLLEMPADQPPGGEDDETSGVLVVPAKTDEWARLVDDGKGSLET